MAKKIKKNLPKVYKQSLYTTVVVVVNGGPSLWTKRFTPAKSCVYQPDKPVHHWRVEAAQELDKISATSELPGSAQNRPVDIKRLIHRGALDFRLRSGKLASTNDERRAWWISTRCFVSLCHVSRRAAVRVCLAMTIMASAALAASCGNASLGIRWRV